MPAVARQITREDILPDDQFRAQRKARRAALLPIKALRRVELGPYCTAYFECFETMLFQIQEMLLIEKGGEAQVADELAAYNPLIPQGRELVATVMFEIEDSIRRTRLLAKLGGVEDQFFIEIDGERAGGLQEGDVERTREDGKTSSVHFLRFPLTDAQAKNLADRSVQVLLGCNHPLYDHRAVLGAATRAELARDLAPA